MKSLYTRNFISAVISMTVILGYSLFLTLGCSGGGDPIGVTDIPDGFPLSEKQQNQIIVAKSGEDLIEKELIESALDELEYPLYFLILTALILRRHQPVVL